MGALTSLGGGGGWNDFASACQLAAEPASYTGQFLSELVVPAKRAAKKARGKGTATAAPHVYVCGLERMGGAVRDLLRKEMGLPRQQVHSERYD